MNDHTDFAVKPKNPTQSVERILVINKKFLQRRKLSGEQMNYKISHLPHFLCIAPNSHSVSLGSYGTVI